MITILKNILKFITDPKNTRMIMLGVVVILLFLFLQQCGATKAAKQEVELQKRETQRIANNHKAAVDTIKQYQLSDNTWRAEKRGFELTIDELKGEYSELLGDFKIEKNKPPKVVVKTEYIIRDSISEIPVLVKIDDFGNTSIGISDSVYHSLNNFRFLNGRIPYEIKFNEKDSTYNLVPGLANFELTIGMNLNLGLFQDKKTREITIIADTDYPGVYFTQLNGASIMSDPESKKVVRSMRKPWSIGINAGYGAVFGINSGQITTGPYVGVGLNYSPKFLQWGR